MTEKEKGAGQGAQNTATSITYAANCSTEVSRGDKLTVLETYGPKLTKIYKSDGSLESYDDAASYKFHQVSVSGLAGVATLLGKIAKKRTRCLIRGKPKAKEEMQPGPVEGSVARLNVNFDDQPLHWMMIDIDKFSPFAADPVREPEEAILEYMQACLPPEFQKASYYWQLSSSAGMPGNERTLKAHVHFWLKTPYASAQLYAWAKAIGPVVDSAAFRRVQVLYTADPIFEEGREDPVPVRSGLHQGETDELDLVIDEALLAQAREQGGGSGGDDMKLKDPSEKDGLIGLFHRVFSPEDVLLTLLEGEFEQATERRYTWHNGGGTPEGVWVHSDQMHVGSSHNTWPIDGIANLWDLVRVFKFGHLDETEDDFERLNLDEVGHRPSDQAMFEWAGNLPEIIEAQEREAKDQQLDAVNTLQEWRTKLNAADSLEALNLEIIPGIQGDERLTNQDRELLVSAAKAAFQRVGFTLTPTAVKKRLRPARAEMGSEDLPTWARDWYYVTDTDKFYHYDSGEELTMQGFNARYNRKCAAYADEDGNVPRASDLVLNTLKLPVVVRGCYMPTATEEATYWIDGQRVVNTYRPSTVPVADETLTAPGKAAVATVERHIMALCGGREDVAGHLLDYLAFNVQCPGQKIRYSPVIVGVEGDGKNALGTLLAEVMGAPNILVLEPRVLTKSDFNGWAQNACVCVVDELRIQGHSRFDALNALKPLVTNDTVSIHAKGRDPYQIPNVMNFLALTNFKDALPLSDTDRRWFVIFTPWDNIAGMEVTVGENTDAYFKKLFRAIHEEPGALRRWLLDRDLSGFNPDGRAPVTAEKSVMVELGVGEEQATARELIEQGLVGVSTEVVCPSLLTEAMRSAGVSPPKTSAMSNMLMKLGFKKFVNERGVSVLKWRGESHRVWVRGLVTSNAEVVALLDATMEAEIAEDFAD